MKPIKEVTEKLNNNYSDSIKWTDIYDTEGELINDLLCITIREHTLTPQREMFICRAFRQG